MPHMHQRNSRPAHPAQPRRAEAVRQCRSAPAADAGQRRLADLARQSGGANAHGLPQRLREGVERLSGLAMGHVQVHRDSPEPARMQALAFAQDDHIHLAPGQEAHLPHEAWHVVQQAQGRVAATRQHAGGAAVNDDPALEREADAMGRAALQGASAPAAAHPPRTAAVRPGGAAVAQCVGALKVAIRLAEGVAASGPPGKTLLEVFNTYREEVRDGKAAAANDFAGRESDYGAQTSFSKALKGAEVQLGQLKSRIRNTAELDCDAQGEVTTKPAKPVPSTTARKGGPPKGTQATEKGKPVGRIVEGNDAFAKASEPSGSQVHALYHKYDANQADGLKAGSDYIQVHGRMLRRHAFRGITPAEVPQIQRGGTVKPLISDDLARTQAHAGMHFENGMGWWRDSTDDKLDLSYLQQFSDLTAVEPSTFGFVHGRRGVGKFFSFRSTPGDITSNHGASFSSNGEIQVDLAQVPEDDFVFHYAGGGAASLSSGIAPEHITNQREHDKEVARARESVLRNREVILKAYPASAVTWTERPKLDLDAIQSRGFHDTSLGRAKPAFIANPGRYQQGRQEALDHAEGMRLGEQHKRAGQRITLTRKQGENAAFKRGYFKAYHQIYTT